jgi:NADH dehydrogenase FAD-containing subunit
MTEKKKVVVVGGGVGGSLVAKSLEQQADVTLIDPYVSSMSSHTAVIKQPHEWLTWIKKPFGT